MKNIAYKIRFDGSIAARTYETELPKGWFETESGALKDYEDRIKAETAEANKLRDEANLLLDEIEREFTEFRERLKERYNGSIYADGRASDDTGLDTYHTITTVMEGELRSYEFTRKITY